MNGRIWSAEAIARLRELYPDTYAKDIARALRCSRRRIYQKAAQLGLSKSAAFRERELARTAGKLRIVGARHRFPKGHVPANKGLRRPGWHAGRMRETQFKKGQFPVNRDPDFYVIGALRVNTDGYIDMRTSFAAGASGWTPLHRVLWQDAHGPVPKGHCLIFKDRDQLNVCIENLELITRAENCRRNSIHNLPTSLKLTIHALGQLKRRIREKQDRGSARSSFCDAGGPP